MAHDLHRSIRPGYDGPEDGYPDLRLERDFNQGLLPCEVVPTLQAERLSGRHLVAKVYTWGAQTLIERSYKYAIDLDGNIRVGRLFMQQPAFPQYAHHSQLVNGANVYGAGWIEFNASGQIAAVNALSYHYWPVGAQRWGDRFFDYLKSLLIQLDFDLARVSLFNVRLVARLQFEDDTAGERQP